MEKHLVYCDHCRKNDYLQWNGEHWLIPEGWFELLSRAARATRVHLCPFCIDKLFSKKVKERLE